MDLAPDNREDRPAGPPPFLLGGTLFLGGIAGAQRSLVREFVCDFSQLMFMARGHATGDTDRGEDVRASFDYRSEGERRRDEEARVCISPTATNV